MKSFLKMTLATIVGLLLFSVISTILSLMMLGALVSSTESTVELKQNAVYELELSGSVVDRVESDEYAELMSMLSDSDLPLSLENVSENLEEAAKNKNIKGVYLKMDGLSIAPATAQALRHELAKFKESGKFIVAYSDSYSQYDYWIASVADKVYMNPQGMFPLIGVNMQSVFFTETLQKIGLKMQVFRVGTFKSAVEPYTQTEMSPANRLQMLTIADGIWGQLKEQVAASRQIEQDSIQNFADRGGFFKDASMTVDYKLVDSLCYESAMENILKARVGAKPKMYSHNEMTQVQKSKSHKGGRVAVLYASGSIDGNGSEDMQSAEIVEELNKLAENDKVKAVVLRVNSPGGSAFGSEQMWYAAQQLKAKKPLVVSMGDYAASGGYYMSCNANKIFAEPTTLTGSIGIFGMVPDAQGLVNKVGLHFDNVGTAQYSDFGDLTRPMTEGEKVQMQAYVERGYELFVKRCADGRNLSVDSIKAIAQGRVWLGIDALKIGLVDELGGLQSAIDEAAKLANLDSYTIFSYPAKKDLMTKLMSDLKMSAQTSILKQTLGDNYRYFEAFKQSETAIGVQARIPYAIYFD